jgi:predicted metallopeptidase
MAVFNESQELYDIALKLIKRIDRVGYINVKEILFLDELETTPKALARCFIFGDHPITHFIPEKYCIVRYRANTDYLSPEQLAILVLHELMHIPLEGNKVIDHDVKDFVALLKLRPDWAAPGAEVPDILEMPTMSGFDANSPRED